MLPRDSPEYLEGKPPTDKRLLPLSVGGVLTFALALFCAFPNPALPIGASTGLQVGQVLILLTLPIILLSGLPKRQTLALILLVGPVLVSMFILLLTESIVSDEIALNSTIGLILVFSALVSFGRLTEGEYLKPLLAGIAVAILIHAALGIHQIYWFAQDVFPLAWLYQNPSFSSTISNAPDIWAIYVKRPFGLFPEPSAMTSSLGPWIVLISGILLRPSIRREMNRSLVVLLTAAVIFGMGIAVLSRSGFVLVILVGLIIVGLPALGRLIGQIPQRLENLLFLALLVFCSALLAYLSVFYIGDRVNLQSNSSWTARLDSIILGVESFASSSSNLLFGVGPGQSYLLLQSQGSDALAQAAIAQGATGLPVTVVWSALVVYVQETGLLGVLSCILLFCMVLRAIWRSSAPLMGIGCFSVWLLGVTFATSYLTLLPIWAFFSLLLGWDRVFRRRHFSESLKEAVDDEVAST